MKLRRSKDEHEELLFSLSKGRVSCAITYHELAARQGVSPYRISPFYRRCFGYRYFFKIAGNILKQYENIVSTLSIFCFLTSQNIRQGLRVLVRLATAKAADTCVYAACRLLAVWDDIGTSLVL